MILVLGVGRSGSSTVARLLHTKVGVSMGTRFRDPDEANPLGYYEDLDFLEVNTDATLHGDTRVSRINDLMSAKRGLWGLKEPRIPHYWRIYREHIARDTKIIIAERATHLILNSLRQHYGWGEGDSLNLIVERRNGISQLVQGFDSLQLDFTERRSDSEITRILTNYVR